METKLDDVFRPDNTDYGKQKKRLIPLDRAVCVLFTHEHEMPDSKPVFIMSQPIN